VLKLGKQTMIIQLAKGWSEKYAVIRRTVESESTMAAQQKQTRNSWPCEQDTKPNLSGSWCYQSQTITIINYTIECTIICVVITHFIPKS